MKNGKVWKVTVKGYKQAHSANDIEDELMISISYPEKFKYVPKKYIYGNFIWCVHTPHPNPPLVWVQKYISISAAQWPYHYKKKSKRH